MASDTIAPDGSLIHPLVTGARQASLVLVRLAAGRRSLAVRHRTVEEIWYVLEGSGRVALRAPAEAAHAVEVVPGSVLHIPTAWAFQFEATGDGELRFLCYTSPPWPGEGEAEPVTGSLL